MQKQLYLAVGLSVCTLRCQDKQVADEAVKVNMTALATDEPPQRTQRPALNFAMYAQANRPVRNERDLKARQAVIDQLKKQLAAESPLLAPFNAPQPPHSLAAADRVYRQFVLTHRNSLILPLFQQRYARSLLVDYGMRHTRNWAAIAYYTDQLLTGQSLDYPLITSTLVKLKGHLPAGEYTALLQRATSAAEAEWHRQRQHIDVLNRQLARGAGRNQRAITQPRLQQGIAHLSADCIGPEVATLRQLAKSS